jgi:hypothetical protein
VFDEVKMSVGAAPRLLAAVLLATLALGPQVARADRIDCATRPTLEELVSCVKVHMPGKQSQGFLVPTPGEQVDWRSVVWAMLNGSCDNIILPASLAGAYTLTKFIDRDTASEHCVLLETVDDDGDGKVDRGWGTFIANPRATRELVVLAPHPLSDVRTHLQSVEVYKGTRARCVLIAGAHRGANERSGACGQSRVSDPTHSVETMFQPTVSEAMDFYEQVGREYVVLQFHGMAESTCAGVDVHLSNGDPEELAGERVNELQARLLALEPDWMVTTPETNTLSCALDGSQNVQVRLLSGVPYDDVCDVGTEGPTPQFVHIEQKRAPRRQAEVWIAAIRDTWPRWKTPKPPETPMVAAPAEVPAEPVAVDTGPLVVGAPDPSPLLRAAEAEMPLPAAPSDVLLLPAIAEGEDPAPPRGPHHVDAHESNEAEPVAALGDVPEPPVEAELPLPTGVPGAVLPTSGH